MGLGIHLGDSKLYYLTFLVTSKDHLRIPVTRKDVGYQCLSELQRWVVNLTSFLDIFYVFLSIALLKGHYVKAKNEVAFL